MPTTAEVIHDELCLALIGLQKAETLLLQLPTDADDIAIPYIQQAISHASYHISGAAYGVACLDLSIKQHDQNSG